MPIPAQFHSAPGHNRSSHHRSNLPNNPASREVTPQKHSSAPPSAAISPSFCALHSHPAAPNPLPTHHLKTDLNCTSGLLNNGLPPTDLNYSSGLNPPPDQSAAHGTSASRQNHNPNPTHNPNQTSFVNLPP